MQGIGYKGVRRFKRVKRFGMTQRQGNCYYFRKIGHWPESGSCYHLRTGTHKPILTINITWTTAATATPWTEFLLPSYCLLIWLDCLLLLEPNQNPLAKESGKCGLYTASPSGNREGECGAEVQQTTSGIDDWASADFPESSAVGEVCKREIKSHTRTLQQSHLWVWGRKCLAVVSPVTPLE